MKNQQPETQQEQYERALERARKNDLMVMGFGKRKSDGAVVYGVMSASKPNHWHLVIVEGARLDCTCPAGEHGRYCMHRALVRERMTAERTRIAAQTAAPRAAASRGTHPGDTALMRRSNRPFSLMA